MKRFTGHVEEWGTFVDVKMNAGEVLDRQLKKVKPGNISLGTVTDPYQPVEMKYGITLQCLLELAKYDYPVSILTKSALILRDIDLLMKLRELEIGFTITALDEDVKRIFEPKSSSSRERLDAIRELSRKHINTWVFFGPVLPYFSDREDKVERLFSEAAEAGTDYILVDSLNLYPKVWNKVRALLYKHFPQALDTYKYYHENKYKYQEELKEKITTIGLKFDIPYRFAF
jgi:DNA repair photolyase